MTSNNASATKGRCPKCGANQWLGPVGDINDQMKLDVTKAWNQFSTPKLSCRKCGAAIRYADRAKANLMFGAYVGVLVAGSAIAFWAWGPIGFCVAVVVGCLGIPLFHLNAEYKTSGSGHDS